MSERLSEWKLRQEAEALGVRVTGQQFRRYQEWGLIPDSVDGGWTAETVGRLVEIRKLGKQIRSLPRRVVFLRRDYARFPVPTAKLRDAMAEIVSQSSGFQARKRKMKRIDDASEWWLREQIARIEAETLTFRGQARRLPSEAIWRRPDAPTWPGIISDSRISNRDFEEAA